MTTPSTPPKVYGETLQSQLAVLLEDQVNTLEAVAGYGRVFSLNGVLKFVGPTGKVSDLSGLGATDAIDTKSDNYTVDAADSGKIIDVDTDAKAITLPATVVGLVVTIRNAGADGTVALNVDPNANDKIQGVDLAGTDDKDLINTKATAKKGDFVTLLGDGADGWWVVAINGTWVLE